ncbi:MAG: MmcQ/YjbR family DNA-binding protein [Betaproteobacteria bacterium]
MADQEDVRRIALSLPGTSEGDDRFGFSVENGGKQKGFAWVWMERKEPKKPRLPRPDVLAVRVKDQAEKAALLAGDPERFFTEPHYNGYPAVLVRLPRVTRAQLQKLLEDAWRCQAPRTLLGDRDQEPPWRRVRRPRR